MGFSIRKPLGGRNSFVRQTVSHPGSTLVGSLLGPGGAVLGAGLGYMGRKKPMDEGLPFDQGQSDEDLITKKYNDLATGYQNDAAPLRNRLAESLTSSGKTLFEKTNPFLLEDLNSRGLFSSPAAVNQSQSEALAQIAAENQGELNNFDTDVFNNVQNLKTTGTATALDRLFGVHDLDAQSRLATSLAKRSSRDNIIASILGLGGRLGAAALT